MSFILASRFQSCAFFHERTCAKHPVGSSPGTMARDGFLLFFFIFYSLSFSLPLIRLHRKSELPFVCNGESRKGEGARSTAREKKWKRSRRRGRTGRVRRVAWEQRKATRRKMQRVSGASSLPSWLLSIFPVSFYSALFSVSFLPPPLFLPYSGPLPRFYDLSSGFQ